MIFLQKSNGLVLTEFLAHYCVLKNVFLAVRTSNVLADTLLSLF